jgi:hypothetical protein
MKCILMAQPIKQVQLQSLSIFREKQLPQYQLTRLPEKNLAQASVKHTYSYEPVRKSVELTTVISEL